MSRETSPWQALPGDLAGELAAESHPLDGWWKVPYIVEDDPAPPSGRNQLDDLARVNPAAHEGEL